MNTTQFHLQHHLDTNYRNQPRQLAFRSQSSEEFAVWKQTLRTKVRELLGIIGRTPPLSAHADRLQSVDRGNYVEEKFGLDVGDGVIAPMYVLVPKSAPPYRAVLAFHGHDPDVQNILGN